MSLFLAIVFAIWCTAGLICMIAACEDRSWEGKTGFDFDKCTLPQKIFTIFMAGPIIWLVGILFVLCILIFNIYDYYVRRKENK